MKLLFLLGLLCGCACDEQQTVYEVVRGVTEEELEAAGVFRDLKFSDADCLAVCLSLLDVESIHAPYCALQAWTAEDPDTADTAVGEDVAWLDCRVWVQGSCG